MVFFTLGWDSIFLLFQHVEGGGSKKASLDLARVNPPSKPSILDLGSHEGEVYTKTGIRVLFGPKLDFLVSLSTSSRYIFFQSKALICTGVSPSQPVKGVCAILAYSPPISITTEG